MIHPYASSAPECRSGEGDAWEVVRLEAGAEQRDTPHIMRHSAATWLMQNGVDLWEAAGYLGMSPEILNSVYGHHSPSFQQNAARSTAQKRPSNA